MLLELHLLQNFAPSNLNRDDTGSPKDCQFGGYTRARISSQCLKRAIRTDFKSRHLIPSENLATRTKRLVDAIADRLDKLGKPREQSILVATALLNSLKLGVDAEDRMTEYLLFVSEGEIAAATQVCMRFWDSLLVAVPSEGNKSGAKTNTAVPADATKLLEAALNSGQAADLALFGRMIADRPDFNVEAASQVAHAISTHAVSTGFDFYTAVDDLKPDDTTGADMLGQIEFNSACFYRYANIDISALASSLTNNSDLARRTVWAFIHASVNAIPTGKQNSMAAHNKPSFVMVVVREDSAYNLANAFLKPTRPGRDTDLCQASLQQLDAHWGKLTAMYGQQGIRWIGIATLEPEALNHLKSYQVAAEASGSQIDALANQAVTSAFATPTAR